MRGAVVVVFATALMMLGVQNAGATADPLWSKQYGPVQIGAPTAWTKSTGKNVKVAVVDSGVDVEHPDLQKNLDRAASRDFACNDDNPDDDSTVTDGEGKEIKGHGTHVTGTIAATANNNEGVAGVAPDVSIMVEKVFPTNDNCGNLVTALGGAANAINWAVDHGAKAINLSLGEVFGSGVVGTISTPCNNAFNRGSLCVIAAGNSGETRSSGYEYDINAIIVTANDSTGSHATFGQKADTKWSVSAPGVDILSTWPIDDPKHNHYNAIQGTSMAAPHVTAAAALLFGAGMNNKQVVDALLKTAGPARDSVVEGAGLIHVDKALGLESASTSVPGQTATGPGTVTKGNRASAGGGSAATKRPATTTTTPGVTRTTGGVSFEEGLADEDSNSYEAIRLKQASRNAASKPFNAAGPLVGLSILATVVSLAIFIPRLRTKDTPLV